MTEHITSMYVWRTSLSLAASSMLFCVERNTHTAWQEAIHYDKYQFSMYSTSFLTTSQYASMYYALFIP